MPLGWSRSARRAGGRGPDLSLGQGPVVKPDVGQLALEAAARAAAESERCRPVETQGSYAVAGAPAHEVAVDEQLDGRTAADRRRVARTHTERPIVRCHQPGGHRMHPARRERAREQLAPEDGHRRRPAVADVRRPIERPDVRPAGVVEATDLAPGSVPA